jgi:anaerobic selenocysteine-containing dehydrogenase
MRPDGKPGFATPSGKIEAVSLVLKKHGYPPLCEFKEPMAVTADYPLVLISGSRVPYITHSKWREDAPWLLELQRQALLTINPRDAANRNIESGNNVILTTPYGRMTVTAKPTLLVPAGVVGVEHGWKDANVNELIPRQFDPISGFPPYKEIVCEVVKA